MEQKDTHLLLHIKSKLDNNHVIATAFRSNLPNFRGKDPLPGHMVLELKALEGGATTGTTIPGGELEYRDPQESDWTNIGHIDYEKSVFQWSMRLLSLADPTSIRLQASQFGDSSMPNKGGVAQIEVEDELVGTNTLPNLPKWRIEDTRSVYIDKSRLDLAVGHRKNQKSKCTFQGGTPIPVTHLDIQPEKRVTRAMPKAQQLDVPLRRETQILPANRLQPRLSIRDLRDAIIEMDTPRYGLRVPPAPLRPPPRGLSETEIEKHAQRRADFTFSNQLLDVTSPESVYWQYKRIRRLWRLDNGFSTDNTYRDAVGLSTNLDAHNKLECEPSDKEVSSNPHPCMPICHSRVRDNMNFYYVCGRHTAHSLRLGRC